MDNKFFESQRNRKTNILMSLDTTNLDIDVKKWLEQSNDMDNKSFYENFNLNFPGIDEWASLKKGGNYAEFKKKYMEDQELFSKKYREVLDKEKIIDAMWNNTLHGTSETYTPMSDSEYIKRMADKGIHINKTAPDNYSQINNEIDKLENRLNNSDDFNEEQILKLKQRIKEFEDKLKEREKPKTITISNNVHNTIKNFCGFYNYKIGEWVEKVIMEKIEDMTPKIVTVDTEKAAKEIKEKYSNSNIRKLMFKSDKILSIKGLKSKFLGFDIESKPVYDYYGDNYQEDTKNIKCKLEVLPEGNVLLNSKYIADYSNIDVYSDIDIMEESRIQSYIDNMLSLYSSDVNDFLEEGSIVKGKFKDIIEYIKSISNKK